MVRSPCIGVCTLDERTDTCIGCHRTMEEIASWPALGDDARRAVLALLAERRARRERGRTTETPPAAQG